MTFRKPNPAEYAVNAPVTAELMTAAVENPFEIAAGGFGADRIQLGALPRLVPGAYEAARVGAELSAVSTSYATVYSFSFLQQGVANFSVEYKVSGETGFAQLARLRFNSFDILSLGSTTSTSYVGSGTFALDFRAGDRIDLQVRNNVSGERTFVQNLRIFTNNQIIYPTQNLAGHVNIPVFS